MKRSGGLRTNITLSDVSESRLGRVLITASAFKLANYTAISGEPMLLRDNLISHILQLI